MEVLQLLQTVAALTAIGLILVGSSRLKEYLLGTIQ